MLVTVTNAGDATLRVRVLLADEGEEGVTTTAEEGGEGEPTLIAEQAEEKEAPNPILPVPKEIVWTLVTFFPLLILMRYVLLPKLKKGMDARAARVRADLEAAESVRADAERLADDYEVAISRYRVEASERIDAARRQLEQERADRLAEVNARISQRKAEAAARLDADRQAAMGQLEQVVQDVAAAAAEKVLGRPVDPAVAGEAATEVLAAGVNR